jgi:alpha-mannosidase
MSSRELILLSPYRFPAQNPLMLSSEDVAGFLNGYSALWHPAALQGATGPPRISSPYDYEQPQAGHVYAVPETPPSVLADDWEQRVHDSGAIAFRATPDRQATVTNLLHALRSANQPEGSSFLELEPARVGPFLGIGFGYGMIETLFEAMDHQNVLSVADFWSDMQQALAALHDPDPAAYRGHLKSAADRLLAAREVLYPVAIHLLDICLLDNQRLADSLPASFDHRSPLNVVASAALIEKLAETNPEGLAHLREAVNGELVELCGGPYEEREDALVPVESQLWNLIKGIETYRRLLGKDIQIFARKRFGCHRQLPTLLQNVGLRKALLLPFDESVLPTFRATVVNWPAPDGKQVEAFTRPPHAAENPQVFFHWAHYLHKTIAQDHAATLALLHAGKPACPWYEDLLELGRFAPVFGTWITLGRYFNEVSAGEYISPPTADEFRGDYLSERTEAHVEQPVGWFARHARLRRRLDTAWTLAALHRGLAGRHDRFDVDARLTEIADHVERGAEDLLPELEKIEKEAAETLAERVLARAIDNRPGYLLLNPCSFVRRVALELEGMQGDPPRPAGPLKACQVEAGTGRLVVEVPALGFAWVPRNATPGDASAPGRMRLADARSVRNEFFEAEIDPVTGGLRALRDHRTRANRLGQQLVFNPGSSMRAREVTMTSSGPALGEIVAEGTILDDRDQPLAHFRQRYRAWLGRPVLEIRIEITPLQSPQGYPWHAYYGARFAWGDERATLLRGISGTSTATSYTRPETPDFLEIRSARQSTVLFPGGLPFHQRHAGRMLDIILFPEGETTQVFDLGIGLDRDYPMQTAVGMVTPVPCVPVSKGPPHVGASGWLFHLDTPNLILTSLRPASGPADAIVARLLECNGAGGQAELRCVRQPRHARLVDAQGASIMDASTTGDAVLFEVAPGDLLQLRVEFE